MRGVSRSDIYSNCNAGTDRNPDSRTSPNGNSNAATTDGDGNPDGNADSATANRNSNADANTNCRATPYANARSTGDSHAQTCERMGTRGH